MDTLILLAGIFSGIGGFFSGIGSFFTSINWEAIVQLTMLAAIAIAGPAVVFVLAARGGDL
ncbi:photosystem II reaction center protein Ycf12 [Synechococcales cyanobacterium C]|uniref:Photosystem II reaction center protein Psb30 n=1 Tax=Petrachloros mirabilis ULC683 TaxID=2781853 RepID=A0A8K2A7I6_9CYAN|nr:photosystem II reaction center protein Ycf12 [Petrachloros mirabilis ULC683]